LYRFRGTYNESASQVFCAGKSNYLPTVDHPQKRGYGGGGKDPEWESNPLPNPNGPVPPPHCVGKNLTMGVPCNWGESWADHKCFDQENPYPRKGRKRRMVRPQEKGRAFKG